MRGIFHIVTATGEEWHDANAYRHVETQDYIETEQGKAKLVGEVLIKLYYANNGVGINLFRPPLEMRAKSIEYIPEYIMPNNVYVVSTTDWNDETEIEGIFTTEEKAEAFKKIQPAGPFRRYVSEYDLK